MLQELAMDVVLVPVLRAGLGMVDGISNLIPTARIGHIGMYRDHVTLKPMTYCCGVPDNVFGSSKCRGNGSRSYAGNRR